MALASIFYNNGHSIKMWTNSNEEKEMLLNLGHSDKVNFDIPKEIQISTNMKEVINDVDIIVLAIPSKFMENTLIEIKKYYNNQVICISSKGIRNDGTMLYNIVKDILNIDLISVISGGTFAVDMVYKVPIGLTIASHNNKAIEIINNALKCDYVKIDTTEDVIGTEVCGSIKNVFAILMGIIDGMEYPISTTSMFFVDIINSIKMIINKLGGNTNTLFTYAGIGDIFLTCTSDKSRNYTLGKMIGINKSRDEIDIYIKENTLEGLEALKSLVGIIDKYNIDMKTVKILDDVIYGRRSIKEIIEKINN